MIPDLDLRTTAEGHSLRCTWRGDRLQWTLTRTLLVRPDGVVEARYEATNTGTQRLPFLWSACLLMPLGSQTRLKMPDATRFRVQSVLGVEEAQTGSVAQQWPRLAIKGSARDLSSPWQLPRGSMVTGWLDLAHARAALQVGEGAATLSIATDGSTPMICVGFWRICNASRATRPVPAATSSSRIPRLSPARSRAWRRYHEPVPSTRIFSMRS